MNDSNYKKYQDLLKKHRSLEKNYDLLNKQKSSIIKDIDNQVNKKVILELNKKEKVFDEKINKLNKEINQKDNIITDKDKQIEALKKEIARITSVMNNDSNNSGIPTSKTPLNKTKKIPNSRVKSEKQVGGQVGHSKNKLVAFDIEEATEIVEVIPEECPKCKHHNIQVLDTSNNKCETDYDVKVIKRVYKFRDCMCLDCKTTFTEKIPNHLKEENQYGTTIQSLAVCLSNEIYTPFNKTVKLIKGITNDEISPSEGYITKLQPKAANLLDVFINDLKNHLIKQAVYAWDDSTVIVNTKQATLRTYCTDSIALFIAHEKKDKKSLDEDNIFLRTPRETIVMHDHLLINYNSDYYFENVECLIHLIRRLKKMKENTDHSWLDELIILVSNANKERNKLIDDQKTSFSKEYIEKIYSEYDKILIKGEFQNDEDKNNYFKQEEINFIKDLKKYKENYLLWIKNFHIPSTNNISERSLRPIKSKMKISGQFKNIEFAKYHAIIRSYIETCKRNGINIITACDRLMRGNPYSLEEILNKEKQESN